MQPSLAKFLLSCLVVGTFCTFSADGQEYGQFQPKYSLRRLPRSPNPNSKDLGMKRPLWIDMPEEDDEEVDVVEKRRIDQPSNPHNAVEKVGNDNEIPSNSSRTDMRSEDSLDKSSQATNVSHQTPTPTGQKPKAVEGESIVSPSSVPEASGGSINHNTPSPFGLKPPSPLSTVFTPSSHLFMNKDWRAQEFNDRSDAERPTPRPFSWSYGDSLRHNTTTKASESLPAFNYDQFRNGAERGHSSVYSPYAPRPTTTTTTTTTEKPRYEFGRPATTRPSLGFGRPPYNPFASSRLPPSHSEPKTPEAKTPAEPNYGSEEDAEHSLETPDEERIHSKVVQPKPPPPRVFPLPKTFLIDTSKPDTLAPMREYLNSYRQAEAEAEEALREANTERTPPRPVPSFKQFTIDTSKPNHMIPMREYLESFQRDEHREVESSWSDTFPWRSQQATPRPGVQEFRPSQPERSPSPFGQGYRGPSMYSSASQRYPIRKTKRHNNNYMQEEFDEGSPLMDTDMGMGPTYTKDSMTLEVTPKDSYICSLNNPNLMEACRSICGQQGRLMSCSGPYCYCIKPPATSVGEFGQTGLGRCGPNTDYGRGTCRMVCPDENLFTCDASACYCGLENMEAEEKVEAEVDDNLGSFTVNASGQYVYCGPVIGRNMCGQLCNGWEHVTCDSTTCYCNRKTY